MLSRRSTPMSLIQFKFQFRCQRLKQRCPRRSTAMSLIQFNPIEPDTDSAFETTLSRRSTPISLIQFKFKFRCQRLKQRCPRRSTAMSLIQFNPIEPDTDSAFETMLSRRSTPISLIQFKFKFRCQRLKQRCPRRSTAMSLIQFNPIEPDTDSAFETMLSRRSTPISLFQFKFKFRCQRLKQRYPRRSTATSLIQHNPIEPDTDSAFETMLSRRSTPSSLIQFKFKFRCQRLKQRCPRRSTATSLIQHNPIEPDSGANV